MIRYIGSLISGNMSIIDLIVILGSMCFVVFCATPLHEYAHAWAAVKLGDDTPRLTGRLTVNPMAHVDKWGMLMIFLFGFGYAKPVEVRMRNFKNPKRDMSLVALAGPLCNLLQALVLMVAFSGFYKLSFMVASKALMYFALFFYYAAVINVNLAVFNLIPIPPLDGSRLLTALLPAKYYYGLMKYERYIMIALFVLLFTGILTTPLSFLSSKVMEFLQFITGKLFGIA